MLKVQFNAVVGNKFQVKFGTGTSSANTGAKHYTRKLICTKSEQRTSKGAGTQCGWSVTYTLVDERTWVLSGASPCARGEPSANQGDHTEDLAYHNHGFYACVAEAASHACAHVPEMLDRLGRLMAASRQPGHVIRDALVAGWKADHPSTEPPWGVGQPGYKFIYDRYCQTGGSLDVDFDGLMEQLSDRKANRGLPFFLDHNPQTLRVNRMYVALAGGVEEWWLAGGGEVGV